LIEGGRVLMVPHEKLGVYLPPGGHVEPNETPSEAVVREFREETGLLVRPVGPRLGISSGDVEEEPLPVAILLETVRYPDEVHIHYDLVFLVERVGGSQNAGEWFDVSSIDSVKTYDNVKSIIKAIVYNMRR
jgi:8-oxo-dGTP pyrophosphatase MutT (NUDIX family)